jgi:ABC-type nitrate/sulfonate/bicarbonate transport system permease component
MVCCEAEGSMSQQEVTTTQAIAVVDLRKQVRAASMKAFGRGLGKSALVGLSTFAIVFSIWMALVLFADVSPYILKTPLDVWEFFFVDDDSAENRTVIMQLLSETMRHAGTGFAAGLSVAIVGAILFRISRGIESALMPFATLLRSVPLIAMAPVIILIFGFGTDASVAVIGGIVVLFPALVTIALGLKSASPQMLDVVSVFGGNIFTAVGKVALPSALPSLFAAIRISVPGAMTGALLSEMLSTGDGIGSATAQYAASARFTDVWACVVIVTVVSLALYTIVQVIESVVLERMGVNPDKRSS